MEGSETRCHTQKEEVMTIQEQEQVRPSDRSAADEIRTHHAAMVAELDRLTSTLLHAGTEVALPARDELVAWFRDVLVPHADEEEATSYRAAAALVEGRSLIEAMTREHVLVKRLVGLFETAGDVREARAYARSAFEVFESHQRKENELILPLLEAHRP